MCHYNALNVKSFPPEEYYLKPLICSILNIVCLWSYPPHLCRFYSKKKIRLWISNLFKTHA